MTTLRDPEVRASVTVAAPRGAATERLRRHGTPYLLLLPAAVVLGVVLGYPLVRLVVISLQDYGLRSLFTGAAPWVGTANYRAIFTDPDFGPVLARTFGFCASLVVGTMAIGLPLAMMMNALGRRMRTAVTLVLIAAWAMPSVAATLVWQWLFQPFYGVVNWLLSQLHLFGDYRQHVWTAHATSAFLLVWLLVVWQSVPFVALALYAGISQIPKAYYEAAQMDGARAWHSFRVITLPFLRPVLLLVVILSVIWDFNVFTQIWILTQGGPGTGTTTMGIWSVTKAFSSQSYGEGAAIAVVTVVLLMLLTGVYVRRLVRSGEDL